MVCFLSDITNGNEFRNHQTIWFFSKKCIKFWKFIIQFGDSKRKTPIKMIDVDILNFVVEAALPFVYFYNLLFTNQ